MKKHNKIVCGLSFMTFTTVCTAVYATHNGLDNETEKNQKIVTSMICITIPKNDKKERINRKNQFLQPTAPVVKPKKRDLKAAQKNEARDSLQMRKMQIEYSQNKEGEKNQLLANFIYHLNKNIKPEIIRIGVSKLSLCKDFKLNKKNIELKEKKPIDTLIEYCQSNKLQEEIRIGQKAVNEQLKQILAKLPKTLPVYDINTLTPGSRLRMSAILKKSLSKIKAIQQGLSNIIKPFESLPQEQLTGERQMLGAFGDTQK